MYAAGAPSPAFPPPQVARFLATLPPTEIILGRAWIISHVVTIFGAFVYMLTAIKAPVLGAIFYTLADLGAVVTYALIIYKQHYLNRPFVPSVVPLSEAFKSENFHLLLLALLWLITPAQLFKILPFYLYLLLNVVTLLVNNVLSPASGFSQALRPLLTYFQNPILDFASHVDLILFPVIFIQSAIRGSFYGLIMFFFIWCLRVECSYSSRRSIYTILNLISKVMAQPNIPPPVLAHWMMIRERIEMIIPLSAAHGGGLVFSPFAAELSAPVAMPVQRKARRRLNRGYM